MKRYVVVSTSEHEFVVEAESRDAAAESVRDMLENVENASLLVVTINEVMEISK